MNIGPLIRLALLLVFTPSVTLAGSFDQDFVVVFIDENTEAKFGPAPINRTLLAEGIDAIAASGARGLIVKFFFDQSKGEKDDKRLAASLSRLPTVLQARLDNAERRPNPLADKFTLTGAMNVAVAGSSGWIPLPAFANNAMDIGFVDFSATLVPMVEQYKSRNVKSLVMCAIELATGKTASIAREKITIGGHVIHVDDKNQATAKLNGTQLTQSVSFNAVLDRSAKQALKGKVVILAYDGPNIDQYKTPFGAMGAHRYFVNILRSIYDNR